ncbi:MAG TPA: hypothetical protein VE398_14570 [Acidobacteriota bacterium]|nr:hypothetical protein [Acidobacteriota bacterium]
MDSRERFGHVMRYGMADRVPLFEDGIRAEVLEVWRGQGLTADRDVFEIFSFDPLELIEPELKPDPEVPPSSMADLELFRKSLDANDPRRLGQDWSGQVRRWQRRTSVLMLSVSDGLFLSLGVRDWSSFSDVAQRLVLEPQSVLATMRIQGEFAACLAGRVLTEVEIDAAVFDEPVCDNHGPLVSPAMYEEFALQSYMPILDLLRKNGVQTIIFRTWANARPLLPRVVQYGFNCLWAYEANSDAMDYRNLRQEFGRDLRLIGGIDLDKVREGGEALRREILEKVPLLLAGGGYIPLADGRVREDVPYANYVCYRRLLEEVAGA